MKSSEATIRGHLALSTLKIPRTQGILNQVRKRRKSLPLNITRVCLIREETRIFFTRAATFREW